MSMDWCQKCARLAAYWVWTETGLAFLIDIELHWIGSEFTPQGCGLGNPIHWLWYDFGLTSDWPRIGNGFILN